MIFASRFFFDLPFVARMRIGNGAEGGARSARGSAGEESVDGAGGVTVGNA